MATKQWSEMTQEEKWQSFDQRIEALEKRIENHSSMLGTMTDWVENQNKTNAKVISILERLTTNGEATALKVSDN